MGGIVDNHMATQTFSSSLRLVMSIHSLGMNRFGQRFSENSRETSSIGACTETN